MATSCSFACNLADIFFFLERLNRLTSRFVVASGQTLRQTPHATTSKAGATGINTFHKTNKPMCG